MDAYVLVLLLYLAPSRTQVLDYDYERRQKYMVNAYDWSYEEVPDYLKTDRPRRPPLQTYWNTWWKATPWAVGIRGKYSSDRFLFERCMGVLVHKYYVITFCSCVCSWYASHRVDEAQEGTGMFRTPKTCDKHYDIRSGKIFAFFQFEIQPNNSFAPTLITDSLEVSTFDVPSSPSCDLAIDSASRSLKMYYSYVILVLNKAEVDLVFSESITNMNPPWPPAEFDSSLINLNITTYGARLDNPFNIMDETGEFASLDQRPITVSLGENKNPYECSHFAMRGDSGICLSVALHEVCGFLPGSPLIGYDERSHTVKLIGLVQNHLSCYGRDARIASVHVIPLARAMELWENVQAIQATEKAQYDVQELPWDDGTKPSYIDLFAPDALVKLASLSKDEYGKAPKATGRATKKTESFAIIFIFIIVCY